MGGKSEIIEKRVVGGEEKGVRRQEMTGQRQKDREGTHSSGCLCVCQQEIFCSYEDKML